MYRQTTSLWIKSIIAIVIGGACYLSMQQAARADSSRDAPTFASPIPGNIMVYRVGDGSAVLSSAAAAVFVDEYQTDGTLIQSIPLPITVSGSQRRLTASGTAVSEGLMTLSEDRQYLVLTGYDAAPGTSAVASTAAPSTNRVIGRVDIAGNTDTSTTINDAFSAQNIRSVASDNGARFWATGANSGVRYVTIGNTGASVFVSSGSGGLINLRYIKIGRGQLYVSTGSGTASRLNSVGVGLPTTSGQTINGLAGIPTTGSPYSFYLADLSAGVAGFDTVYIADDGGTIQKFSLVAGTWTANGTAALVGVRGLTGIHDGSTVTLYATTNGALLTLIDVSGYNATISGAPVTLVTAGANTAFRGVAFAPGTSPTAVQITNLSTHPTNSTSLIPLIALGLLGLFGAWLILRHRGRTA